MGLVRIEINEALLGEIDAQLARMAKPNTEPLHAGVRKAATVVKQRNFEMLPKPGYPGDRPKLKALRDTITVKTAEYVAGNGRTMVFGLVGYAWGAGSHGHPVEHGHRIATRKTGKLTRPSATERFKSHTGKRFAQAGIVQGRHDLEIASKATLAEQSAAIVAGITQCIDRTLGPNPTEGA
jgi:hypothetical protein